jgi:twitching motility protein PilT
MHSSSCAEALQRIVSAFPAESQPGVASQLSDCLVAVITQRLRFRPELNIRVPECEILMATHAVKNFIRNRDFFKIASALETGADHGMWSYHRYHAWLESRKTWSIPGQEAEPPDDSAEIQGLERPGNPQPPRPTTAPEQPAAKPASPPARPHRIVIEPEETEFGKILKRPNT